MSDSMVYRKDVYNALVEKGQASRRYKLGEEWELNGKEIRETIENVSSAEPEIIYCKDCRKHNQGINEAPYLTDRCPLILHRGYAQGHEFDYQFCVYAESEDNE